jgi:menaquinone-9 beta-reductase
MTGTNHDLIIIGGGLGGSALAAVLAKTGKRVLVVERETRFRDRVRGEGLPCWGVAEARELGLYELIRDVGHEVKFWDFYFGPGGVKRRDLIETTPQRLPILTFHHPDMQEAVLGAAVAAGAEVRRGAVVTLVKAGDVPRVTVEQNGHLETLTARMVVGADGRTSSVRGWAGFAVDRDPDRLFIGGVLLEGMRGPEDAVSLFQGIGRLAILFPQGRGRTRAYVAYHKRVLDTRLQGAASVPQFFEESVNAGAPADWYADARVVGPLATFEGADTWVDHPYRFGVALIGDAAAASDPSWGQGLALTLRDVRELRDQLLRHDDWDAAGQAYAVEHDRYYGTLHAVEDSFTKLFMEVGVAAEARRQRALPRMMEDPTRMPDVFLSGPGQTFDEEALWRFLGA